VAGARAPSRGSGAAAPPRSVRRGPRPWRADGPRGRRPLPRRRPPDAPRAIADRRRRGRGRRGPRGPRSDGGVLRARAGRRVARAHRDADPKRDQTSGSAAPTSARDGLRGPSPLLGPRPHLSLRLERRRHGLRRGDPRPRPGGDPVRRLIEDVHDPGDDDQRAHRARAARSPGSAGPTQRSPNTSSRPPPTRRSSPSSASTPTRCSGSGSGWAAATRWTRQSGSTMLAIGPEHFTQLLAGFHELDEHFREAPLEANLP